MTQNSVDEDYVSGTESQPTDLWLETIIKRCDRDQSIKRLLRSEMTPLAPENQGHLSKMCRASLEFILASGEKSTKRLIVKSRGTREFAKVWEVKYGVFRREVQMYASVLRKMEHVMSEHGDSMGRIWPRLHGCYQYDTLIFDDLEAKGYETFVERTLIGLEDSLIVLSSLAHFHGLSMVLFKQGSIQRNEFGTSHVLSDEVLFPLLIDPLRYVCEVMKSSWGSEWQSIAMKMESLIEKTAQLIKEILNSNSTKMGVLNHGDCRSSNFMIKRDRRGRPMKCKLVDFQTTNYNTLTLDLHYFMVLSIKPDVRRCNYDKLIETYHCALTETLRFYEYPPSQIPSLSQINEEMKRSSVLGFAFLPSAAAFTLNRREKVNFDTTVTKTADKAYDLEIYQSEKFKELFAQDFFNFFEKGTLH